MDEASGRRRVAPEVWAEIRAAWEAGETAQSVARRYGVGLNGLWKRRAAGNWGRAEPERVEPLPLPTPDQAAELSAAAVASLRPVDHEPEMVARRAIAQAVAALNAGDGGRARQLAKAAEDILRLGDQVETGRSATVIDEERRAQEARTETMLGFIARKALEMGKLIAAGEPLPPPFDRFMVELEAEEAREQEGWS